MSGNKDHFEMSGQVLVVDDHAQARQSMGDVLTHAGYDVTCRSSAVEALNRLNSL